MKIFHHNHCTDRVPLLPLCVNAISIKLLVAQYVIRLRDIRMYTRVPRNVIFIGTHGPFLHELRVRSVKGEVVNFNTVKC